MARSQVPKFGNWESEEVPYTAYFDNARKAKKADHPHQIDDPQETKSKVQQNPSEPKISKHERRSSRDENEPRRSTSSPRATVILKPTIDSQELVLKPRHERKISREENNYSNSPRRVARQGLGSDRSVEHSPHHPQRGGGKGSGVSSPSWERKASTEGPSTPGRSRLRSVTRGDDSPDHGPAVPKFGEWDESDPASAEGYTHIFNRVREEKHSETGKVPVMPTEISNYSNGHKQYGNDNTKGCGCFPWGKR